ncbi:MAG: TetR/AcrR family transcriptional regulator [Longimicrobiales bacterium]|nr:TetR/AcrR family transcriptional regulator [Longimicrobiales bacterium]
MATATRGRILSEATELYLRDGFDGFSMRALARAVGVTAPALYRHYTSREHVLHEVIGEAYRRLGAELYTALSESTPKERLLRAIRGYVDFALGNPRLYEVLFVPPRMMGDSELPEEIEAQACAIGTFFDDRVRECVAAGVLRDEGVSPTVWAHTHGLVSLYLRGRLDDRGVTSDAEFFALFERSTTRILEGVGGSAIPRVGAEIEGAGGGASGA